MGKNGAIWGVLFPSVVIEKNRNEFLEWTVVAESQPDDDDEDIDECVGLKNLSEVTRARYDILLAHLFLHLTFKVSIVLQKMLFFNFWIFLLLPFSVSHLRRAGRLR
jgi:hypothetical protein